MATAIPRSDLEGVPPFSLHHDEWGRLVLVDAHGHRHEGVSAIRAFPISAPQQMISIMSAAGHELFFVEDFSQMSGEARSVLAEEFARREFLPNIMRIVSVSGRIEPCEWQVETDHGPHRFVLGAYEDVHRLGPQRAIIVDSERVRYLIPDLRKLDPLSRRYLERYL